jgi:hypothetical protein
MAVASEQWVYQHRAWWLGRIAIAMGISFKSDGILQCHVKGLLTTVL